MSKSINIFSYDDDYKKMLNSLKNQRNMIEIDTNFGTVLVENNPNNNSKIDIAYKRITKSKYAVKKFNS